MKKQNAITYKPLHLRNKQDVVDERLHRLNRERAWNARRRTQHSVESAIRPPLISLAEKEWVAWLWNTVRVNATFVITFVILFIWMATNAVGQ